MADEKLEDIRKVFGNCKGIFGVSVADNVLESFAFGNLTDPELCMVAARLDILSSNIKSKISNLGEGYELFEKIKNK